MKGKWEKLIKNKISHEINREVYEIVGGQGRLLVMVIAVGYLLIAVNAVII